MNPKTYALSSLEKYILAFESDAFSFSSHLLIEMEQHLEKSKILQAMTRLFEDVPLLRSKIVESQRVIEEKPWFNSNEHFYDLGKLTYEEVAGKTKSKFNLAVEPPLKVGTGTLPNGNFLLMMTVHHTAVDGIGQGHLLNEFLLAYNGHPLSDWVKTYEPFSFQKKIFEGEKKSSNMKLLFWSLADMLALPFRQVASKNLIENFTATSRKVRFIPVPIDEREEEIKTRASQLGFEKPFDFLLYSVICALRETTSDQSGGPISIITPLNLRLVLKIKNSLQNIDGLCRFNLTEEEASPTNLASSLKWKVRDEILPERAFSLILLLAIATKLLSAAKLSAMVRRQEFEKRKIISSAFVSAGRLPRLPRENEAFGIKRIFGYGSLTRSPGLGIIFTGVKNKQTLVVEYLEGLIPENKAQQFTHALLDKLLTGPLP